MKEYWAEKHRIECKLKLVHKNLSNDTTKLFVVCHCSIIWYIKNPTTYLDVKNDAKWLMRPVIKSKMMILSVSNQCNSLYTRARTFSILHLHVVCFQWRQGHFLALSYSLFPVRIRFSEDELLANRLSSYTITEPMTNSVGISEVKNKWNGTSWRGPGPARPDIVVPCHVFQ